MSDASEPTRLSELAAEAPELAAAIRGVRAEHAQSAQLETLAHRLAPQLTGSVLPGTAAGISLGPWVKGLLGLTLLGVGIYLAVHRARSDDEQRRPAPRSVTAAASRPVAAHAVSAPEHVAAAASDTAIPASDSQPRPSPTPTVRSPRVRAVSAAAPTVPTPTPESELALLERARAELDRDPATTLVLVAEHAGTYPQGLFAQEREVLAIEALLKRKQRSAARARAAAFVQNFPDSAHVRRVRGLLELVPAPPLPQSAQ